MPQGRMGLAVSVILWGLVGKHLFKVESGCCIVVKLSNVNATDLTVQFTKLLEYLHHLHQPATVSHSLAVVHATTHAVSSCSLRMHSQ